MADQSLLAHRVFAAVNLLATVVGIPWAVNSVSFRERSTCRSLTEVEVVSDKSGFG